MYLTNSSNVNSFAYVGAEGLSIFFNASVIIPAILISFPFISIELLFETPSITAAKFSPIYMSSSFFLILFL